MESIAGADGSDHMKGEHMSSSNRSRMTRNMVKPIVVAVALALPGAAALAADMGNVVTTRVDQNIDEQYGRDSVYAFSRDAKPLKPEQQGSHELGFLGNAFHKTTGFVAGAWHKTTSMFNRDDGTHATYTTMNEPQRYGRAGGYIGSDRVAVIAGTADRTAIANADSVKTGQELDNAAATRGWADHRDQSTNSPAMTNPPNEPSVVTAPEVQDQTAPSASSDSVGAPANDSAMSRDESSPVITAPVVEEQRDMGNSPSDDSAADRAAASTEQTPMDQSAAPADDVVRTSPTPASDNGRVDSATDQKELDSQTQQTR
jgi:hypothetical protein